MTEPETFTDLYVISDLHIGGSPGRRTELVGGRPQEVGPQMFCQGRRLGAFLEALARPDDRRVALVVAGDFVDTLPFLEPGRYIDVDQARARLRTIAEDPGFAPVFTGLGAFARAPGRSLVILLGNHDLELAFEGVQAELCALLGVEPGQVRFATDGVGWAATVSGRRVYVSHGNEADPWNHVDHERLRRARHRAVLGLGFYGPDWEPNAGTSLVVDVMNEVKRDYPFVDLLKPEIEAAVPTVLALAPEKLRRVLDAGPAARRRAAAALRPPIVLGADGLSAVEADAGPDLLARALRRRGGLPDPEAEVEALWRTVEAARDRRPSELAAGAEGELGPAAVARWIGSFFGTEDRVEATRLALLDWTSDDRGFALDHEDEVCKGVMSQAGSRFDVVVTGHTHLARQLRFGPTSYLNPGTWARLMRLPAAVLGDRDAFAALYALLGGRRMADLDAGLRHGGRTWPLLLDATLSAHVGPEGAGLLRVEGVTDVGGRPDGSALKVTPLPPWPPEP